ncbi:T cell receptor alpha variable 22 [Vulpes lagopus]
MRRYWGAVLGLLWVHGCLVTGMKVEQSPSALSLQEGASCTLKCNSSSTPDNVQWFRQNPGGGSLTRLFYIASGMKQSGRLNCTLNAKDQSSTLHVTASQLEDSATYLCAVEAQCSLVICSLPPNCRWACSTSTSLGRACACTELHVFRFSDFQIYVTAFFFS